LASQLVVHKCGKSEGWYSKGRKQEEENVDKQEDGTKREWFPSWISWRDLNQIRKTCDQ